MNRTFIAHSPLGDQLEFRSMEGTEQISRLFEFRVRLLSQNSSISAKSLLGKDMSIEVDLTTEKGGGGKRFISGQVTQFTYIGKDGDFICMKAYCGPGCGTPRAVVISKSSSSKKPPTSSRRYWANTVSRLRTG